MIRKPLAAVALAAIAAAAAPACSSAPTGEGRATFEEIDTNPHAHLLLHEGTCEFLACCSQANLSKKRYPPGTPGTFNCKAVSCGTYPKNGGNYWYAPSFACGGVDLNCTSDEKWLVVPGGACGQTYTICHAGKRLDGVPVRDHPDSNQQWEASEGVFRAFGITDGATNLQHPHFYLSGDPAIAGDSACNGAADAGVDARADGSGGGAHCTPCRNQNCGTDLSCGTGQSCGACPYGETCGSNGQCSQLGGGCTPCRMADGTLQQCGLDATCFTGQSCGSCPNGYSCNGSTCESTGVAICPDGACTGGETCATCAADCCPNSGGGGNGSGCLNDGDCASGYCDGSTGACAERPPNRN